MPVSSYAPELLELFKRAAQKEITLPINDEKRAMRLRFRLNMLRKDMRKAHHPLTTIANSVQFSITKDGDLKCSPADETFLEELRKAGIKVDDLQEAPLADASPPPDPTDTAEILKQFLAKGEKE